MSREPRKYADRGRVAYGTKERNWTRAIGGFLVGGVSLASAIVSLQPYFFSWWLFAVVVLGIALLVSLFIHVLHWLDMRTQRDRPKHLAFLTPSNGEQPYYSGMMGNLLRSMSLAHGQEYVLLPSMPSAAFESVSIWSLFANLEDHQIDINGIFFIPDLPDKHADEILGFHTDRGDIPLVLIDVNFAPGTLGNLPSFVGNDELVGGRMAAEILADAMSPGSTPPVVMLVRGGEAAWECQRTTSLQSTLRERWPAVQFIESPFLNYSRPAAKAFVREQLVAMADADHQVHLDGIFVCNDDMAIGVRSTILDLTEEGYSFERLPQIVGYDGIPEIREYITSGDPFIAGTVDSRVEEQAKQALLTMHQLLRSQTRKSTVNLIQPLPIRRSRVRRYTLEGN